MANRSGKGTESSPFSLETCPGHEHRLQFGIVFAGENILMQFYLNYATFMLLARFDIFVFYSPPSLSHRPHRSRSISAAKGKQQSELGSLLSFCAFHIALSAKFSGPVRRHKYLWPSNNLCQLIILNVN